MGPCHACNGPHFIKDCNESICNRCKPNLDNHAPAKYPRKRAFNRQQKSNPSYYNNNSIRNQSNGPNDPDVQLSISTSKLDNIAELLEATRKMTKYFKTSYKHNKTHHSNTDSHHPSTNHNNTINSNKYKCRSCNTNDQVNEIIGQTSASRTQNKILKILKTPLFIVLRMTIMS